MTKKILISLLLIAAFLPLSARTYSFPFSFTQTVGTTDIVSNYKTEYDGDRFFFAMGPTYKDNQVIYNQTGVSAEKLKALPDDAKKSTDFSNYKSGIEFYTFYKPIFILLMPKNTSSMGRALKWNEKKGDWDRYDFKMSQSFIADYNALYNSLKR